MAENVRPPVAIRIVRPYDSEDELLEHELDTIGKTSVILIGAHPRPAGVILRFEVTLASGATVLRGEGRVLAHKERAFRGQPGLSLRFTRLDPRSKAVVDRATAMRSARGSIPPRSMEPPPSSRALPSEPEVAAPPVAAPEAATPDAPATADAPETATATAPEAAAPEAPAPEAPAATIAPGAPTIAPAPSPEAEAPPAGLAAPPNRDELLARLRQRAAEMPPERVEEILARAPGAPSPPAHE